MDKPADESVVRKVLIIVALLGAVAGVVVYQAYPDLFYGQVLLPAA